MGRRVSLLPILLLYLSASSCAYYSTSGGLVGGIRSIGVPTAESQTAEFDIAEGLSERAIEGYTRDGRLRVVDEENADALLQLVVVAVEDKAFTYTSSEQTEQYRFSIRVRGELVRVTDEEMLRCYWNSPPSKGGALTMRVSPMRKGATSRWRKHWIWS